MSGAAPRIGIRALSGVVACVTLLLADGGPVNASCPTQCPAPASWTQPFSFAGLEWERKAGCGGPGPNCWAPENVERVPGDGIHLRLTRRQGRWYAAEIRTTAAVPCGTYSFQLVGRTDLLDPNVVFGAFLYDDAAGESGNACPDELDLESSRFGNAAAPNGHFVSYAAAVCGPADLGDFAYTLTGTYTTGQIAWAEGSVTFRLMHGHRTAPDLPEHLIGERHFASPLVPGAGGMRLHVNLWAFAGNAPTDQQEVEVVIRDVVRTGGAVAVEPVPAVGGLELAARVNPARYGVDIQLALPADGPARVMILDVAGRRVATLLDARLSGGPHALRWEAASAKPGVYFIRLEAGGRVLARRLVLLE
jgi:hypothetical protein